MTEADIKHMADRFLGWKLPANFNPDDGIGFDPIMNKGHAFESRRTPSGTNLLDADQALAMVRYMVEGLPLAEPNREASMPGELKPCPFCGAWANIVPNKESDGDSVECSGCRAFIYHARIEGVSQIENLANRWNRRDWPPRQVEEFVRSYMTSISPGESATGQEATEYQNGGRDAAGAILRFITGELVVSGL